MPPVNLSGNTVLITGGSSGIGLEVAKAFAARDNTVIITGTRPDRIDSAVKQVPGLRAFQSDVADVNQVEELAGRILRDFPDLNVLVNNAGIMEMIDFRSDGVDNRRIVREIATNFDGPIQMTTKFLPHLMSRPRAAIVNVTSGLAFVPLPAAPVYCATKAGMHSFTESLRMQLQRTNVAVFEVAPPITATHLYGADGSAQRLGLPKPMEPSAVAERVLDGMEKNRTTICPGLSNVLRLMSRIAPSLVLRRFSHTVDRAFHP